MHGISDGGVCATSKALDQPAHDDDTVLFCERKVQRSTQVRFFKVCLSALHETWNGLVVENCQF